MAARIASRGPDDYGCWVDADAGVCLAHRRLSVVDLSPAGHQPMCSPGGRYVLVYNGEIYNHAQLRRELDAIAGHRAWRGHSDTETLLAAVEMWGVEGALQRLNGMFAFALWDRAERTLTLARDRMGEKPLYYGHMGGAFLFGSQLKALSAYPKWRGEIDRKSVSLFLRHSYVPAPRSIYDGVFKLPPAHYIVVHSDGRHVCDPVCYWDLAVIAEEGVRQADGDSEQLTEQLDALLLDAVKLRMEADVPLGAFLSGGYDSSTVVAMMQHHSRLPVRTFTIGFHEFGYDEAKHASKVARLLGTDHTECYLSAAEAMEVVSLLPDIYDEPFADASQIPTFLVSKLARRSVTVSLSGDGGDELFGGYNRHVVGPEVWRRVARLPRRLRGALGHGMSRLSHLASDGILTRLQARSRIPDLSGKMEKLASALCAEDGVAFYRDLVSHWKVPNEVVIGGDEPPTLLTVNNGLPKLPGLCEQMMFLDMKTYLPDDILTKVDRASMAVSLEARVPMLDHRLVEFAWRVPTRFKVRAGEGKWLLREVLHRYVPRSVMARPKMGFAVPIEQWLRGPLREWAEELLDPVRIRTEGFFDAAIIRRTWDRHLGGHRGLGYHIWDVLMFQAWLRARR